MSATPDSTLANPAQRIADLERQLAECKAELDKAQRNLNETTTERAEALARETATAEVLQVINSSPGDLAPVFDAILEKATQLCEAPFGVLRTWDGERFHVVAAQGDPEFTEWVRGYGPFAPADPSSPAGRIVSGEEVVRFADAPEEGAALSISPGFRALVESSGMRSNVSIALRKDGTLRGNITVFRQEVRPFSDKQIALLQNFAAQAVIAMENARLLTETREALEQQTATAEVLQVINSSPGDLTPVFKALVDTAARLCNTTRARLAIRDGDAFRYVATRSLSPAWDAYVSGVSFTPGRGTVTGRALLERRVIHVTDIAADPEHALPEAVALGDLRTMLAVPLLRESEPIGVLGFSRDHVEPFTERQIALAQTFAAQAVIAMENARLITETRDALDQQTATAEVLGVINSSPGDLKPVFDAMIKKAVRLCGASHGMLRTFDGELFHLAAVHDDPRLKQLGPGEVMETLPTDDLLGRIVNGERLVHIADVRETDTYRDFPAIRERLERGGIRTWLAVALHKDGALLGVITVYRRSVRPFAEKEIALLENFAAQAVIAMENARLITETREALEQQTATAEVLQVINSSPGNLAPVFDAMLEKAMRLCKAAFGMLWVNDGDCFRTLAHIGLPAELATFMQRPLRGSPPQGSALRQLIDGDDLVHVADITALPPLQNPPEVGSAPPWLGTRAALVELGGARTQLVVALRKDESLVGFFHVYRREVQPFSDKEIALLQNFAAQAVIAMENARLLTETREALEQQTATAEVLQVINSSPGDLAPVFDAILEKAHKFCDAEQGVLVRYDGRHFQGVATHRLPESIAEVWREPFDPTPGSGQEQLLSGERLVHIPDITAVGVQRPDNPHRRAILEAGFRTLLLVPLRKEGDLLGYITAIRRQVRPFTEKQIALLQNFAEQAVIAMENARLITETREALEQQTATAEVLQVINSSPGDLAPVFDAILEKAHTLCGATYGGLVIRDRDGFRNVAARGDHPGFVERWRQLRPLHPPQGSPLSRLMAGEKVIHLADAPADDNYRNTTPPEILQLGEFGGLRTLLMVPLRTDDAFLGIITAYRLEVQPFTDKQIALLENFAAQAVIAMENARLLGELRQRTDEVAELNRGLEARVAEQVDELGRVGRLKRFLAPQLAELIVSQGDEKILESHRRDIVVVFCDLRGYTAFTETAEPEEVLDFLREYHGALGPLVSQFEGTLDQFSGDGIMVFFNDPVPCPDPAERAVKMAFAMREAAGTLIADWRERGRDLGFGAGIAQGYATLGQIGFSDRSGYTAIGTVCNVAARLCAEAKDGQILLSQRVNVALKGSVATEQVGALALKGLTQPVVAYNVPLVGSQAAFRVIEGGAPSA